MHNAQGSMPFLNLSSFGKGRLTMSNYSAGRIVDTPNDTYLPGQPLQCATDTMTFIVNAAGRNELASVIEELEAMLRRSKEYWLGKWHAPGILVADTPQSPLAYYAVILDYTMDDIPDVHTSPNGLVPEMSVTIVRSAWSSMPPQTMGAAITMPVGSLVGQDSPGLYRPPFTQSTFTLMPQNNVPDNGDHSAVASGIWNDGWVVRGGKATTDWPSLPGMASVTDFPILLSSSERLAAPRVVHIGNYIPLWNVQAGSDSNVASVGPNFIHPNIGAQIVTEDGPGVVVVGRYITIGSPTPFNGLVLRTSNGYYIPSLWSYKVHIPRADPAQVVTLPVRATGRLPHGFIYLAWDIAAANMWRPHKITEDGETLYYAVIEIPQDIADIVEPVYRNTFYIPSRPHLDVASGAKSRPIPLALRIQSASRGRLDNAEYETSRFNRIVIATQFDMDTWDDMYKEKYKVPYGCNNSPLVGFIPVSDRIHAVQSSGGSGGELSAYEAIPAAPVVVDTVSRYESHMYAPTGRCIVADDIGALYYYGDSNRVSNVPLCVWPKIAATRGDYRVFVRFRVNSLPGVNVPIVFSFQAQAVAPITEGPSGPNGFSPIDVESFAGRDNTIALSASAVYTMRSYSSFVANHTMLADLGLMRFVQEGNAGIETVSIIMRGSADSGDGGPSLDGTFSISIDELIVLPVNDNYMTISGNRPSVALDNPRDVIVVNGLGPSGGDVVQGVVDEEDYDSYWGLPFHPDAPSVSVDMPSVGPWYSNSGTPLMLNGGRQRMYFLPYYEEPETGYMISWPHEMLSVYPYAGQVSVVPFGD